MPTSPPLKLFIIYARKNEDFSYPNFRNDYSFLV